MADVADKKTITVPYDTTSLKDSLKAKLAGTTLSQTGKTEVPDRRAKSETAEERQKRRAVEKTNQELAAELETLKADLEAERLRAEGAEKKVSEYEPHAKSFLQQEKIERARLLEKLPPELKDEAKGLPITNLKSFVKLATGDGAAKPDASQGGGSKTDWLTLYTGDDTAAFDKAMEADPKGWQDFLASQKK